MREIVFDTETTGLDPIQGDRMVEIGCIELVNRFPTGKTFHCYFNPERDMPEPAFKVHGLGIEFLKDKPLFAHKVDELIGFLGDALLVAHNAMFDLSFLNAELERAGRAVVSRERLIDTLLLARRKHPGGSNRLDDLCMRYAINNSHRVKHGALLDAELLAEVYIELIGARQAQLDSLANGNSRYRCRRRYHRARTAGAAPGASLGRGARRASPIYCYSWEKPRSGATTSVRTSRLRWRRGLHGRQALTVQIDEIDRLKQQRRKAAVARCRSDDLAGKGKQQARTLDQHNGLHAVGRHVLHAENARKGEFEAEQ